MIIDADSHYFPYDMFDQLRQNDWVEFYHREQQNSSLDLHWKASYDKIKDPTWPNCDHIADFGSLPISVRAELAENHTITGLKISKDLTTIFLDTSMNLYPRLEDRHQFGLTDLKIDRQLLNSQIPIFDLTQLDNLLLEDISKVYNNTMLMLCQQYPEYDATAWLPMKDPIFDIGSLREITNQNFFGVNVGESRHWGNNPHLFEIFSLCASTRMPVYMHLSTNERIVYQQYATSVSNKYQKMKEHYSQPEQSWCIGIMELITENIIDRLPDLRIVVAERGISWIPAMREFMISCGWPDPLSYFKNNFWFTVDVEEENFIKNAQLVGWDRLLFATDYPHNDPGGINQYQDVDVLNKLLSEKKLTQFEFAAVTHKNYEYLKYRN